MYRLLVVDFKGATGPRLPGRGLRETGKFLQQNCEKQACIQTNRKLEEGNHKGLTLKGVNEVLT